MKKEILITNLQKEKAEFIINSADCRLSKLQGFQLQDIAIQWSYYSGKIEGSTFSLVQTESLIKDNIVKGRFDDAVIHKNMYNTLIQEIEYIKNGNKESIDDKLVFRIHRGLTKSLISDEDLGVLRTNPIRIGGSHYEPSQDPYYIKQQFSEILFEQEQYTGIDKAIFLHCNLARLQPFIDGNKRTSRMLESIVLMNNDLLPTFSIDDTSFLEYREAMIAFYETKDYAPYVDFMLDKQIEIIERFSLKKFIEQEKQQERKIRFRR